MGVEPINIFSHRIDPRGVLTVLRKLAPDLKVEGPEDDWTRATITMPRKGIFRRAAMLEFRHDREYYDGPDWPTQRRGMQGYFSRFAAGDRMPLIMRTIGSFRFSLATFFTPERQENDERMRFIEAVARHLDGCVFMPSGLYDPTGRPLVSADGEFDEAATFSALPPTEDHPAAAESAPEASEEDEPEPVPPTPTRVARRALALAALCGRALLEQEDPADPGVDETRQRILQWVDAIGIRDELEPQEWKVLQRPLGRIEPQDAMNATWRLEGLAVLAWALNRFELPPLDQLVDTGKLLPSVGILNVERAAALIAESPLRPIEELKTLQNRLFAIHWRLVNIRLKPEPMNFADFARTAWFGPLDITGVRLINGDLALGNHAIADAPADLLGAAQSSAMERHLAISWLCGGSGVYSETDVST